MAPNHHKKTKALPANAELSGATTVASGGRPSGREWYSPKQIDTPPSVSSLELQRSPVTKAAVQPSGVIEALNIVFYMMS